MPLPPLHHALGLVDVTKILPNPHQPVILALPTLLTTPPVVLATAQESQPPKIQTRLQSLAG
jgi:hypothetical protein